MESMDIDVLCDMLSGKSTISNEALSWYKIPEIPLAGFASCCERLYDIFEEKNKSKSFEDPFIKTVLTSYYGDSFDWTIAEKARLKQKAFEMAMGYFHQDIIGKFAGWETLPLGHETGLDNRTLDGMTYVECKNKHNTCNADGFEQVHEKLKSIREKGKRAIFVQINCPGGNVRRSNAPENAEIMNGREFYKMISGRNSFFDDLLDTVGYVFNNFKTLDSLKSALEMI